MEKPSLTSSINVDFGRFKAKLGTSKKQTLVVESQGFGARAYLLQQVGDKVELICQVHSTLVEASAALNEIINQFNQQKISLPKNALLVTGSTTAALLELPIEDTKNLSDKRLLELVRWEMEPLFGEQIAQWNIGWLLIGRGYLTEEQRDQVLIELNQQASELAGRGGIAPIRFGEIAVNSEFITREQLEECLQIQEGFHLLDPEIQCSWSKQSLSLGGQNGQGGLWLCSAISEQIRSEWLQAFDAQKLFLQGVYCQSHSAVGLLDTNANKQCLLVINIGLATVTLVQDDKIIASHQQRCGDYSLNTDDIMALLQPVLSAEIEHIYYSGEHPRLASLVEDVMQTSQRQLVCLDGSLNKAGNHHRIAGDAAIIGAAQHLWQKKSSQLATCIAGTPPPPPIYKQAKYQIGLVATVMAVLAGGNEAWFYYYNHQVELELRDNMVQVEKIEAINEQLNSENEVYLKSKSEKEKLEQQLTVLTKRKRGLNSVLLKRQEFIKNLLPLISANINDQLILKNVNEQTWYQFNISGWAGDQLAIDEFNKKLTSALSTWQMQISDISSQENRGVHNLDGYDFVMTIEPIAAERG